MISFDTNFQSEAFQKIVILSSQKREKRWKEKNIRCKFGNHQFWAFDIKGYIAATAYLTCIRCNKKTVFIVDDF